MERRKRAPRGTRPVKGVGVAVGVADGTMVEVAVADGVKLGAGVGVWLGTAVEGRVGTGEGFVVGAEHAASKIAIIPQRNQRLMNLDLSIDDFSDLCQYELRRVGCPALCRSVEPTMFFDHFVYPPQGTSGLIMLGLPLEENRATLCLNLSIQ